MAVERLMGPVRSGGAPRPAARDVVVRVVGRRPGGTVPGGISLSVVDMINV